MNRWVHLMSLLRTVPEKVALILVVSAAAAVGIMMPLAFNYVLSGKFSWDHPFALGIALLFVALLAWIGSMMADLKGRNPRRYGAFQIGMGAVIVLFQFRGSPHPTDSQLTEIGINIFIAWYFFADGFENFKKKHLLPSKAPAAGATSKTP